MRLSVCIDALWRNRDFFEGMRETKKAGIDHFEFWSWWDKDIEKIDKVRKELGMTAAALCTRFISLVDPSRLDDYLKGLAETILIAKRLECKTIITQVGMEIENVPRPVQHANLVNGLKACVPMLEKEDVVLVFEPLNTIVDHKGYYLWSADEAGQIVDEVSSPNIGMLFDIYHQQIMEGNITSRCVKYIGKIGHMHCAGNPGRHELDIGEVNYEYVLGAIAAAGYKGCIGLEYFPVDNPVIGLGKWAERFCIQDE